MECGATVWSHAVFPVWPAGCSPLPLLEVSVLLHPIHCQLYTAGCPVALGIELDITHILGAIDCPQPVVTALFSLLACVDAYVCAAQY